MITKRQTWALVIVVLAIWVLVSVFQGVSRPTHLFGTLSYVVSGTSCILLIWERWLWQCGIFRPWLTDRPVLRGTWKGEVRSNWPAPDAWIASGPIEAYLVIRQTFSSLDVRMFSLESESISLSASLVFVAPGLQTLFVVYRNEPRSLLLERSPVHYGGLRLHVRGSHVERLDGNYWTDRLSKGEVDFVARVKKTSIDFNSAAISFD
jgi:SMODS-associating 2TM, beta-strand rich effector domain